MADDQCIIISPYPPEIIARFWSQVDKTSGPSGCWLWVGSMYRNGYGRFRFTLRTQAEKKRYNISTHRFGYEVQHGPIPQGLHILHTPPCIQKHCVKHLYAGTREQNMQDALAMGRFPTGDRNGARIHIKNVRRGDQHGLRLHPEAAARGKSTNDSYTLCN